MCLEQCLFRIPFLAADLLDRVPRLLSTSYSVYRHIRCMFNLGMEIIVLGSGNSNLERDGVC